LSGRGLCDELITRPEESYRLWCIVVCDLETSRISAPYIYDISSLRVNAGVQIWSGKVPMIFYQQNFDINGLEIRGIVRNVSSQDAVFIFCVEMPIIMELFSVSCFNPIILPVPCFRW